MSIRLRRFRCLGGVEERGDARLVCMRSEGDEEDVEFIASAVDEASMRGHDGRDAKGCLGGVGTL